MTNSHDYRAAIARAEMHKVRLIGNAHALKARVTPSRLKADVKVRLRKTAHDTKVAAKDTVRRHPVTAGAIGTGLLLWLFRRPIIRLFGRFTAPKPEPAPLPSVEGSSSADSIAGPVPDQPTPPPILPDSTLNSAAVPEADAPPPAPVVAAPAAPPVPENRDEK